jgi:hypothetical protein
MSTIVLMGAGARQKLVIRVAKPLAGLRAA